MIFNQQPADKLQDQTIQQQQQNQEPIQQAQQSQNQPSQPSQSSSPILDTDAFDSEFFQPKKASVDTTFVDGAPVATPVATPASNATISPDQAARNTEILMDARDTIQSFGISYFSDGDLKHANLYSYQDWQKQRLIKAWTPIIQKLNINVTPWLDVIVAEAVCTAPLVGLAAQNRKLRLENEKQAQKIAELQKKNDEYSSIRNKDVRTDNRNAWSVDENGFFKYNAKGNAYIKGADRFEKAELNERNYELLVKHNGKELIDKIFKIQ